LSGSNRPPRILLTNDDGWDAPGLAALKQLAAQLGEVYVVAPLEQHSYAGHRVTVLTPLLLTEAAPHEFKLSGTPADCIRVALTSLFPEIDWVLAGINRGGNLGADVYTSGTVAAVREAALLGKPGIAISQYVRRNATLDWDQSRELAFPVIERIMAEPQEDRVYWNVNLPHLDPGCKAPVIRCDPDHERLDVRYRREGDRFHYAGTYQGRPKTPGRDVEQCFGGAITISRLVL
jgi:5'-nucleotidase